MTLSGKLPGSVTIAGPTPAVPFTQPDSGLAGISPTTAGVPGRIPGTFGSGHEKSPGVPFSGEEIMSQEPLAGPTFTPVSSPGWGGRLKP